MHVSVVTVVSRPEIFESCLLASIKENRRHHDVQIIPIINNHNRYSASNALNIGLDVSQSDIVVFAHQDVRFLYNWFDRLEGLLAQLPSEFGVLGCAGIDLKYGRADIGRWGGSLNTSTVAVGSVWDSDAALGNIPYWDGTKELVKIHCADECVLVLNKSTGLRFDPLFTGFHFYGVDLCIQARAAGYSIYGTYLPIIHYGKYSASFSGDHRYWYYLRLLFHKWHMRFPELLGTHFHWSLNPSQTLFPTLIPELTSYINVNLVSGDGLGVEIRAMGLKTVKLKTDKAHGLT